MKTGKLACDEWEMFDQIDGVNLPNVSGSQLRASEFTLTEVDEDVGEQGDKVTGKPPLPDGFRMPKSHMEGICF